MSHEASKALTTCRPTSVSFFHVEGDGVNGRHPDTSVVSPVVSIVSSLGRMVVVYWACDDR